MPAPYDDPGASSVSAAVRSRTARARPSSVSAAVLHHHEQREPVDADVVTGAVAGAGELHADAVEPLLRRVVEAAAHLVLARGAAVERAPVAVVEPHLERPLPAPEVARPVDARRRAEADLDRTARRLDAVEVAHVGARRHDVAVEGSR